MIHSPGKLFNTEDSSLYELRDSFFDDSIRDEYQIIEEIKQIGNNPFDYNIVKDEYNKEDYFYFKYKIIQKIGEGSYGTVYIVKKVRKVRNGEEKEEEEKNKKRKKKLFAMKVIDVAELAKAKAKAEDKDKFIKRFNEKILKEFNLRYVLQEKCKNNLVCYYDIFKTNDEKIFLIMTLVEGKQLGFINSKSMPEFTIKDLTYDRKFKITKDVINAVNVLHKHNIVHRDIKLDNIIYDENNGNTTLIDYGFSCQIPKVPILDEYYKCEGIAGTDFYMHPDLFTIRNKFTWDDIEWEKCDFFSLGYCLYLLWIYPSEKYYTNVELDKEFYESSNNPNEGHIDFTLKIKYSDKDKDKEKGKKCEIVSDIINKLLLNSILTNK